MMSCLTWPDLVNYWARSDVLGEDVAERMEEHLIGCAICSTDSELVAKLTFAVRDFVPNCITRAHLERLQSRGATITENVFVPNQKKPVCFSKADDFLVHRLSGLELADAERVDVVTRSESTGAVMHAADNVPFDQHEGVLIACQRHYAILPPDVQFDVRVTTSTGEVREATYLIPHTFEASATSRR